MPPTLTRGYDTDVGSPEACRTVPLDRRHLVNLARDEAAELEHHELDVEHLPLATLGLDTRAVLSTSRHMMAIDPPTARSVERTERSMSPPPTWHASDSHRAHLVPPVAPLLPRPRWRAG
jgi:hypothetical protein